MTRFALIPAMAFALVSAADADFSYKMSRRTAGFIQQNTPVQISTYYLKGQRLKIDNGDTATILDFESQTITQINNSAKTYKVTGLSIPAAPAGSVELNVKANATGQRKTVNGFNCDEMVITMDVDASQMASSPQLAQMGKMQMNVDIWASPDVPGAQQWTAFYRRNADKFPWPELAGGGQAASMRKSIEEIMKAASKIDGVPVEEVVKINAPALTAALAQASPAQSSAQTDQLAKARARLEAMVAQGGPQAAYAKQALDRLPPPPAPGASAAPATPSLLEVTMDASDFSTAPIPDSVFAIPTDYKKAD